MGWNGRQWGSTTRDDAAKRKADAQRAKLEGLPIAQQDSQLFGVFTLLGVSGQYVECGPIEGCLEAYWPVKGLVKLRRATWEDIEEIVARELDA